MSGVERIAAERQRQLERWGETDEHDLAHGDGELAQAAACYALPPDVRDLPWGPLKLRYWLWPRGWDFRGNPDRIRELEKAGALIAAEIDRLQALAAGVPYREAQP